MVLQLGHAGEGVEIHRARWFKLSINLASIGPRR